MNLPTLLKPFHLRHSCSYPCNYLCVSACPSFQHLHLIAITITHTTGVLWPLLLQLAQACPPQSISRVICPVESTLPRSDLHFIPAPYRVIVNACSVNCKDGHASHQQKGWWSIHSSATSGNCKLCLQMNYWPMHGWILGTLIVTLAHWCMELPFTSTGPLLLTAK